jgi:hypothetical protein
VEALAEGGGELSVVEDLFVGGSVGPGRREAASVEPELGVERPAHEHGLSDER